MKQKQDFFVTKVRTTDGRWGRPTVMTLSELADYMRSDVPKAKVERLARLIVKAKDNSLPTQAHISRTAQQLPRLIFSATFDHGTMNSLKQPTGLLLLSIRCEGDPTRQQLLRDTVCQMPQTLMAFMGSSRRTLKVVVRCMPAHGPLPTGEADYLAFLVRAQRQAIRF